MKNTVALVCLIGLTFCFASYPVVVDEESSNDPIHDQARIILKNLLELKPKVDAEFAGEVGFSWTNCGKKTDAIQVISLTEGPDPIIIPGSVNISAHVKVAKDIVAPSAVEVEIHKKVFGIFFKVPCVDNVGSCTYKSPCDLLKKVTCPPIFKKYGITCQCPIKKNDYNVPATLVKLPSIKIPSFLENGAYKIKATLMNGSERLGCYEIEASLQTK